MPSVPTYQNGLILNRTRGIIANGECLMNKHSSAHIQPQATKLKRLKIRCLLTKSAALPKGKRGSIKVPISVPVSPLGAVECYPYREVTLDYNRSLLFHGGDTGSTPVRDANTFNHLQDPASSPHVQKRPLTKSLPSECLEEAFLHPCTARWGI